MKNVFNYKVRSTITCVICTIFATWALFSTACTQDIETEEPPEESTENLSTTTSTTSTKEPDAASDTENDKKELSECLVKQIKFEGSEGFETVWDYTGLKTIEVNGTTWTIENGNFSSTRNGRYGNAILLRGGNKPKTYSSKKITAYVSTEFALPQMTSICFDWRSALSYDTNNPKTDLCRMNVTLYDKDGKEIFAKSDIQSSTVYQTFKAQFAPRDYVKIKIDIMQIYTNDADALIDNMRIYALR